MESHIQKIREVQKVTHDVLQFRLDKPGGYVFTPGQATEVAINKPGWENEKRPFTFTCLPEDDFLEFTIKTYPSHNGVTNQLLQIKPGDEFIIHDVWGAISYQGEGLFIAGGAGITPFISIFRYLKKKNIVGKNRLIFANKTRADIIHAKEFTDILGNAFINIISDEEVKGYGHGFISAEFIKKFILNPTQKFYVCGPPPMMDAIQKQLTSLGVGDSAVVVEV